MGQGAIETRLQVSVDKRATIQAQAEELLNPEKETLSESEKGLLTAYRSEMATLDEDIKTLLEDKEAADRAAEQAKLVRKSMIDGTEGVDGEGAVYRDFASYARDVILTRSSTGEVAKLQAQVGDKGMVEAAASRLELLKRTPANTLSSNVGGLNPPEHIAQIFQIIDDSRPIVAAAPSTGLMRGQLTYPLVSQRPVVAVQNTEKTEAGNQGMVVDMETVNAVTYLGGGDLSWQAINWSTPDALALWFQLAAADYALKTETAAGQVVTDDAFTHKVSNQFTPTGTDDLVNLMQAIGEGYSQVYANSHRIADTFLVSPDLYGTMLGITSTPQTIFVTINGDNIGPLRTIVSRGLGSGTGIVCDLDGLLVAETPGAPVELRVVEPAIGGVEVGIIGAFKSVVVDPGSFSLITAAS
jgi:HK97 family phage major capsid protein